MLCIDLYKKNGMGFILGNFFHKLIWSHWFVTTNQVIRTLYQRCLKNRWKCNDFYYYKFGLFKVRNMTFRKYNHSKHCRIVNMVFEHLTFWKNILSNKWLFELLVFGLFSVKWRSKFWYSVTWYSEKNVAPHWCQTQCYDLKKYIRRKKLQKIGIFWLKRKLNYAKFWS
jgi:hypothetical protein